MKKIDELVLNMSIFVGYSANEIKPIIYAIYERDFKHFCSQMADYDQPQERRQANLKFDEVMKNSRPTVFEKVVLRLNDRFFRYYHDNFHSMYEESA